MTDWYFILWYFLIFSFIGWINDTVHASIWFAKKPTNSGMLFGPWCPIYAAGAFLVYILIFPFAEHPLLVFLATIAIATLLELIVGQILYKLFKRRWWDYSNWPFNINGHICLIVSVYWGLLGLFMVYVLFPFATSLIELIPLPLGYILLAILMSLFLFDVTFTFISLFSFHKNWRRIIELGKFNAYKTSLQMEESLSRIRKKIGWNQRRFLHSFPNLKKGFENNVRKAREKSKKK
ncbi:MAG: putative ABC transporter permease [Pseudomonadales bacterium]|jgi:uncharacterized membrane protein|nr:putative ABC transporter permease [Pseudomonadales bacterium]